MTRQTSNVGTPRNSEEVRVQLVEAVVTIGETPLDPPSHLEHAAVREADRWVLDPDVVLAAGDRGLDLWQSFNLWRSTFEKRWRFGDLGELAELAASQMPDVAWMFDELPSTLGIADVVALGAAAAAARDTLESGTLPGWSIVADNGRFIRGRNRTIADLDAGVFAIHPQGVAIGDSPVTAWRRRGGGNIQIDDMTLGAHDSRTFTAVFADGGSGHVERTSLSAPWSMVANQIVHACSQAVIHGRTLVIIANEAGT